MGETSLLSFVVFGEVTSVPSNDPIAAAFEDCDFIHGCFLCCFWVDLATPRERACFTRGGRGLLPLRVEGVYS